MLRFCIHRAAPHFERLMFKDYWIPSSIFFDWYLSHLALAEIRESLNRVDISSG